jgi:hypothetical protein
MAMVTEQMRAIECLTFDRLYGVTTYSDRFVVTFHLSSKRPTCGKQVDAVATGNLTVAVSSPMAFRSEEVKFKNANEIAKIRDQATKNTKRKAVRSYAHASRHGRGHGK